MEKQLPSRQRIFSAGYRLIAGLPAPLTFSSVPWTVSPYLKLLKHPNYRLHNFSVLSGPLVHF